VTVAEDILGSLEPFYPADFILQNPSCELQELLGMFNKHFVKDGVLIDGIRIWVERSKSNIKDFYAYPFTFVHIITREDVNNRRYLDQDRAKRAHWIKPILLNCSDERVLVFTRLHHKNKALQLYFWYKNLDYVVIVRSIDAKKQLVTGFIVEQLKAKQFDRWYKEGLLNKKPHIMCGARNLRHCD
jgi:hypothetical protein